MKVRVKLAFFKDIPAGEILSTPIKWWTNSEYCHVEISVAGTWVRADGAKITVASTLPDWGVSDIHEYDIELTALQYDQLVLWLIDKNNSKYDYLGIVMSTVLPARIDNPNKWFCSEITTKILQLMLEPLVYDLTPNMITPGDLAKLYGME